MSHSFSSFLLLYNFLSNIKNKIEKDPSSAIFEYIKQDLKENNFTASINNLPYLFKDPHKLDKKIDIKKYASPIPEFALETALAVKKEIPSATILIDEYRDRHYVSCDPFLVVRIGENFYYLEVWNETKFKGKRAG